MAAKIKKGDYVVVISGGDKGRKGEVLKVMPKENRVIVKGVRMVKRHMKPCGQEIRGSHRCLNLTSHASLQSTARKSARR